MTAVSTEPGPESAPPGPESAPPATATATDRAASQALAAQQVRHAAGRWLTSDHTTLLGQQLVLSIDRYQQLQGRPPTWADALAGIDPALLAPLQNVPDQWPYQSAFWRRELRQHLMTELKRTRWITYTRTPRSLHPGDHGRGWYRTTHPTDAVTQPTT